MSDDPIAPPIIIQPLTAASKSDSCLLPRSRLNLVTFDHVRRINLTQGWNYSSSGDASPLAAPHLSAPSVRALEMNVHTIENLFSSAECTSLLSRSRSQDSLAGEYTPSQRDSMRLLVRSPELAKLIWDRLLPILPDIFRSHSTPLIPMGFGTSGEWTPSGVNPCMRFSDYLPGSKGFAPHRDSAFVQSACERSILTLLIYLDGVEDESTECKGDKEVGADGGEQKSDDHPNTCTSHNRGNTTFYRATHIFPSGGVCVREELPERYFSIQPRSGRAILFPHENLHGGDPIAVEFRSNIKSVLRTDIVFRRYEIVPLMPLEMNWRNSAAYLKAVELFQRAFKYELAGKVEKASDCYERSTSLRVAELQRRQQIERVRKRNMENGSSSNNNSSSFPGRITIGMHGRSLPAVGTCPAMKLISDCVRVVFSFLSDKEYNSAASTCRTWWRTQTSQNMQQFGIAPALTPAISMGATFAMKKKYHRNLSVPDMFKKFLPKLHTVDGITCIMSYPQNLFRTYSRACQRAMAVYAAALFSHRLPSTENLPKHFQPIIQPTTYVRKDAHIMLPSTQAHDHLMAELRRTRIVLSYSPAGEVEWCTFEQLVVAAFRGQEFEVTYGTLEQFNNADENVSASNDGSKGSTTSTSKPQTRVKSFLHGVETQTPKLKRQNRCHPRTAVSFAGLLPMNYYRAGACCGENSYSYRRHDTRCIELRYYLEKKRKKQVIVAKLHQKQNAQELQSLDHNTHKAKWQAALGKQAADTFLINEGCVSTPADTSSSSIPVCTAAVSSSTLRLKSMPGSSMNLSTIVVQEMRSAYRIAYFRVSFIGIPAL